MTERDEAPFLEYLAFFAGFLALFVITVVNVARNSVAEELSPCPRHESGHYTATHPRNCYGDE